MAARSKVGVCDRSLAGIVGSNPSWGHGCLSWVLCYQVEISASGWSLVQRSPTEWPVPLSPLWTRKHCTNRTLSRMNVWTRLKWLETWSPVLGSHEDNDELPALHQVFILPTTGDIFLNRCLRKILRPTDLTLSQNEELWIHTRNN